MNETEASKFPSLVTEYLKQKNNVADDLCNVSTKPMCIDKRKTAGILTFMTTCGTCINFDEMITHESLTSITEKIIETYRLTNNQFKYVIYDTACRLSVNFFKNNTIDELKEIKFYIDNFHLFNHKREECHTKFNIKTNPELEKYNTEACEQNYYTMSKYKHILKHMTPNHYSFFVLFLYCEINRRKYLEMSANDY